MKQRNLWRKPWNVNDDGGAWIVPKTQRKMSISYLSVQLMIFAWSIVELTATGKEIAVYRTVRYVFEEDAFVCHEIGRKLDLG